MLLHKPFSNEVTFSPPDGGPFPSAEDHRTGGSWTTLLPPVQLGYCVRNQVTELATCSGPSEAALAERAGPCRAGLKAAGNKRMDRTLI